MKEVALTKGKVAKVDDCDYEMVKEMAWNAHEVKPGHWYATCSVKTEEKRRTVYMHRMLAGVMDRRVLVDHEDGDGLNNQRSNLRTVTPKQNAQNSKAHRDGVSQYKGVSWSKRYDLWETQIWVNGSRRLVGMFSDEEEAARAYDEVAEKEFGEFAWLNFKPIQG